MGHAPKVYEERGPRRNPRREWRLQAEHDESRVIVYQAYRPSIALPSLQLGRLSGDFCRDRMTWIKPSFLWACHRSGWARKPDQEILLALKLTRLGFDLALANAALTSFQEEVHADEAAFRDDLAQYDNRVQWDPERDVRLGPIRGRRTLQLGVAPTFVNRFVDEWTVEVRDVTPIVRAIEALVAEGQFAAARALVPRTSDYVPRATEREAPVPSWLRALSESA